MTNKILFLYNKFRSSIAQYLIFIAVNVSFGINSMHAILIFMTTKKIAMFAKFCILTL